MTSAAALRRYLSNAALSVPPVLYFRDNFYSLYVVDGSSMMPSLRVGDVVLVRKSDVYPHASWRRWTSSDASPPSPPSSMAHREASSRDDDDDYDEDYDERKNALRVLALDASSGRPIGDRWTGRTYMRPPTVHVVGSVIVYRAPDASRYPTGEYRIKRVVGLGGQLCRAYAGGRDVMVRVPPFALWVEGDSSHHEEEECGEGGEDGDSRDDDVDRARRRRRRRPSSVDSRTYGPICKNGVIGIAERIVWPPSRWGKIPGVDPPMPPRSWWI